MFSASYASPILRVGLLEVPPFVIQTKDGFQGLAVDLIYGLKSPKKKNGNI